MTEDILWILMILIWFLSCLINFGISEAEASAGRIPIKSPRYLLQIHWCHVPCVPETWEIYSQWHPIRSIPITEPMKTAPPKFEKAPCCSAAPIQFWYLHIKTAHRNWMKLVMLRWKLMKGRHLANSAQPEDLETINWRNWHRWLNIQCLWDQCGSLNVGTPK